MYELKVVKRINGSGFGFESEDVIVENKFGIRRCVRSEVLEEMERDGVVSIKG